MIKLNIEAKTKEQELIKHYLEENVSEILADKINNGVKITKDNKNLSNFKTLDGFMKYAGSEAKKLAENNNYACVEDSVVYGWAIHYFEEDSIEEKLFNEDGTEYKTKIETPQIKTETKQEIKKQNPQSSFFDLLTPKTTQNEKEQIEEQENDEQEDEEQEEILSYKAQCAKQSQPDPLFDEDNYKIDKTTGEVLEKVEPQKPQVDNRIFNILNELLDNKLIYKE